MSAFQTSSLLAQVADAVVVTDEAFRIVGWNRAASVLYGWDVGEVLGRSFGEVVPVEYLGTSHGQVLEDFVAEGHWQGEVVQFGRDGERLRIHSSVSMLKDFQGRMIGAVAINRDIRKLERPAPDATDHDLARLAYYDVLTGLPNRRMLEEHFRRVGAQRRDDDRGLYLACFDLDGFKKVNDTYGHLAGDSVLETVARRLKGALREQDLVVRLGGDEFVVVLEGQQEHEVAGTFERIESALSAPYLVVGSAIHVGVSIGIAGTDTAGHDLAALLDEADRAMYAAKLRGGGVVFADGDPSGSGGERPRITADLTSALESEQLICHFQPVVELASGTTVAHEVLLRWEHPQRGRVLPDAFLAAAVRSEQIEQIDRWTVREAFLNARRHGLNVAINISPHTLSRASFVDFVAAELRANRLGPGRVQIEIPEQAFAAPGAFLDHLAALREMGVRIALDDFGTGPSRLLTLGSFPIDILKLDVRFVQGLGERLEARAICGFMTQLAHDLGLVAVAEGVEQARQLELFRAAGGHWAQGALFGMPAALPERDELARGPHPTGEGALRSDGG